MLQVFEKRLPQTGIVTETVLEQSGREEPDATLNCKYCRQFITHPRERSAIDHRHIHRFTNPHGISFRIGCFSDAPGVVGEGEPSDFWSWFPGYLWQIVHCRGCALHLGWRFVNNNATPPFYGLILDRLVEGPRQLD